MNANMLNRGTKDRSVSLPPPLSLSLSLSLSISLFILRGANVPSAPIWIRHYMQIRCYFYKICNKSCLCMSLLCLAYQIDKYRPVFKG